MAIQSLTMDQSVPPDLLGKFLFPTHDSRLDQSDDAYPDAAPFRHPVPVHRGRDLACCLVDDIGQEPRKSRRCDELCKVRIPFNQISHGRQGNKGTDQNQNHDCLRCKLDFGNYNQELTNACAVDLESVKDRYLGQSLG